MQNPARKAEVVTAESGTEQVESGCLDIGADLLGGSTIGPDIQVRDMGPDTAYAEVYGRIPLQGGPYTDGAKTAEGTGRRLGLTPSGGCNGGGGVIGGEYLRLQPPEHRGGLYCDQAHYGPVSGGKQDTRAKSGNAFVGTGWD